MDEEDFKHALRFLAIAVLCGILYFAAVVALAWLNAHAAH